MVDLIKMEKELFSSLKIDLLNDFVKINNNYIPKLQSNHLNRFFTEDKSFWFARLKIKNGKIIYYFGLNKNNDENIIPDLILKFTNEKNLSPIKFLKNNIVSILAKLKNNNDNYAKKLSKHFKISRKNDYYFFVLGEIGTKEIIENLKLFIEIVDYEIDFKYDYLIINDETPAEIGNSPKDILKNNVEIINFINYLNNLPFNQEFTNEIIDYLFILNKNEDFTINSEIFSYELPTNQYLRLFTNILEEDQQYSSLNVENALNLFKNKLSKEINYIYDFILKNELKIEISNEEELLFNEYLLLKETPKIKFHLIPSYGINSEDISNIYNNIYDDIQKRIITKDNDPDLILESYLKQYISEKNSEEVIKYVNEFISSDSYKFLLNKYDYFDKKDYEDINYKIKEDIKKENLSKSEIDNRFKVYFSKKSLEIKYTQLLSIEFKNKDTYLKYGLTIEEINEILEEIQNKIKNWYKNWTIFDKELQKTIVNLIENKQREIRSETHSKFDELFPNKKSIRLVLNRDILPEEEYDLLKDKLFHDMHYLKIRSKDINDELIVQYYNYIN